MYQREKKIYIKNKIIDYSTQKKIKSNEKEVK